MTDLKEKHARLDKATTELQIQLSKFPYNNDLARNLKELKIKKLQIKDKLKR